MTDSDTVKRRVLEVPEQLMKLFEDAFPFHPADVLRGRNFAFLPQLNKMPLGVSVTEDDENLIVKVDVPGIPPSGITIECDDDGMTVSGSFDSETPEKEGEKLHFYGRMRGSFRQTFPMPVQFFDTAKTEASVKDGVLTLTVPKVKPKEKVKVEIKSD